MPLKTKPCKHCGACDHCDPCFHCHHCRRCGQPVVPPQPLPITPYPGWWTYPTPWPHPYPTWVFTPQITCGADSVSITQIP